MSRSVASSLCLALFAALTFAQQTAPSTPDAQKPDQIAVDATLQRYLAAYQHKSVQDLLAVWPDLQNQKKEYAKIKHQFEDPNISDEQLTLKPLQTESATDGMLLHAQRAEQYVKTERSSSVAIGDLRAGAMPAQDPGPRTVEKKKPFKKSDTVWIKLHKAGDAWTITSISEQKPQ